MCLLLCFFTPNTTIETGPHVCSVIFWRFPLPLSLSRPNGRQSVGELAGRPSLPVAYTVSLALTTKNVVYWLDQSDVQDTEATIGVSRARSLIWLWSCNYNAVSTWRLR